MANAGFAFAILLLAVLVAGCSQPGGGKDPASASASHSGTGPAPSSSTRQSTGPHGALHAENETDGLRITADADTAAFRPPGNVSFTWTVTNEGSDARRSVPPSCRPERNPEITVTDAAGHAVQWRRTDQPACMVATQLVEFPSGSSFTVGWTWDGTVYNGQEATRAAAGQYTVMATFDGERGNQAVEVRVSLDVQVVA